MSTAARPPVRPLAAVLLAAAAVRLAYFAAYARSPLFGVYRVDQLYYRTWGLALADGTWRGPGPFEQGPLYAYLLAAWYRLFGPTDTGVLLVQLLAGALGVLLVAWCAGRLFGRASGIAAGAIAAVYGPAVFSECMLMKTSLEALLVLAALAAALRAAEARSRLWPALAGAAVGLACLVREAHVLLLLPLLAAAWADASRPRARRLAAGAVLAVAFAAVTAPATLYNAVAAGEFVGTSAAGGENAYLAFGPEADGFYANPPFVGPYAYLEHQDFRDEAFLRTGRPHSAAASSRYWFRQAWDAVRDRPAAAAALVARKAAILVADFDVPDSENFAATREAIPLLRVLPTFGWIVGAGLLGLVLAATQPRRHLLLLGFAAALVAEILLTFNLGRYRAALAALWTVPAGHAAAWLAEAFRRPEGRRRAWGAAAAAALVSALSFLKPYGLDPAHRDAELRRFGSETAANARERDRLPGLQRAASANPGDPAALLELGAALQATGRWHEATRVYRQAVAAAPEDPEPRVRLVYLLYRQNRPAEAAPHAEAYARLLPRSGFAHFTLGRLALLEASRAPDPAAARAPLARAVDALRTAARLDPRSLQARLKLARALHLSGDAAGARAELQAALAIDPASREGRSLAATIFAR